MSTLFFLFGLWLTSEKQIAARYKFSSDDPSTESVALISMVARACLTILVIAISFSSSEPPALRAVLGISIIGFCGFLVYRKLITSDSAVPKK